MIQREEHCAVGGGDSRHAIRLSKDATVRPRCSNSIISSMLKPACSPATTNFSIVASLGSFKAFPFHHPKRSGLSSVITEQCLLGLLSRGSLLPQEQQQLLTEVGMAAQE